MYDEEQLFALIYNIEREKEELKEEIVFLNRRLDNINYLLNNCVYRLDNLVIKED